MNKHYKTYAERVVFEKENALLASTQDAALCYQERCKKNEEMRALIAEKIKLSQEKGVTGFETYRLNKRRKQIVERLTELRRSTEIQAKTYIMPCGSVNCRGFIDTSYRCALCDTKWCAKCREIKGDVHECDPELVASVITIKNECKPCPNCKVSIVRAYGCNVMWCTNCHIFFDWSTLKITRESHNPHYEEWRRQNGNSETVRGAYVDNPNTRTLAPFLTRDSKFNAQVNYFFCLYEQSRQAVTHYSEAGATVQSLKLPLDEFDELDFENAKLLELRQQRILYILGSITREQWSNKAQRIAKRYEFRKELIQIYTMFTEVSADILEGVYREVRSVDIADVDTKMHVEAMINIIGYTKSSIGNVEKIFKQKDGMKEILDSEILEAMEESV